MCHQIITSELFCGEMPTIYKLGFPRHKNVDEIRVNNIILSLTELS